MPTPDYSQYGSEELLFDEAFRQWVRDPTPEREAYWQQIQDRFPHLIGPVAEARRLVGTLRVETDELGQPSQQRIWQSLETRLDASPSPARRWAIPRRTMALAATLTAVLLLAMGGWWSTRFGTQTIRTDYGETRQLRLPDGSTVLLNGNSSLRYEARWDRDEIREVWLQGEAFFRVSKQHTATGPVKFVAHTANTDIRVLGTEFNVDTRHGNTVVTLVEGKIQLSNRQAPRSRVLDLRPGQLARVRTGAERVAVERVRVELHDAWTRQVFSFENTPLRDIAQRLRDTYGLEVSFEDEALADKRFTANLSSENLETLLTVIAATYDLTMERTDERIQFRRK